MKIFLDTASIQKIREAAAVGCVDGVTTNPTLIAKERMPFRDLVLEICKLVSGPVSVEVIAQDADGMVREALDYASWAQNIVVKIPFTPEGLKAVRLLAGRGVKTNVTLIFSANQALLAAKAGATYASVFIGRLDDIGHDGMQVVRDALQAYRNYAFTTELIVASVRHPLHVLESAKAGAHVCTVPPDVFEKLFKHPLTDSGIRRFLEDWEKVKAAEPAR